MQYLRINHVGVGPWEGASTSSLEHRYWVEVLEEAPLASSDSQVPSPLGSLVVAWPEAVLLAEGLVVALVVLVPNSLVRFTSN